MFQFGVGLSARHPYESQPWDWFVITRPVAFYWESFTNAAGTAPGQVRDDRPVGVGGAGDRQPRDLVAVDPRASSSASAWWLTRRDWRAGAAVLGIAAGWASWLPFTSRTKFYYYALEFEPFLIICIVLCLGLILGSATAVSWRRALGSGVVGFYLVAVVMLFFYFYPIMSAQVIPYSDWLAPHVVADRRRLDLTGRNGAAAFPGGRPAWLLSRLSGSAQPAPDLATYLEVI